jgi:hypothetical protein
MYEVMAEFVIRHMGLLMDLFALEKAKNAFIYSYPNISNFANKSHALLLDTA